MMFFLHLTENSIHSDDKKQNRNDRYDNSSSVDPSALDHPSADLLKRADAQIIGHFLPLVAAF